MTAKVYLSFKINGSIGVYIMSEHKSRKDAVASFQHNIHVVTDTPVFVELIEKDVYVSHCDLFFLVCRKSTGEYISLTTILINDKKIHK